jgi:hypothetical protein
LLYTTSTRIHTCMLYTITIVIVTQCINIFYHQSCEVYARVLFFLKSSQSKYKHLLNSTCTMYITGMVVSAKDQGAVYTLIGLNSKNDNLLSLSSSFVFRLVVSNKRVKRHLCVCVCVCFSLCFSVSLSLPLSFVFVCLHSSPPINMYV